MRGSEHLFIYRIKDPHAIFKVPDPSIKITYKSNVV